MRQLPKEMHEAVRMAEAGQVKHVPRARQPKVADLEVAGGVQEQVARLQVAVQDIGRVHVLQPAQDLHSSLHVSAQAHTRFATCCRQAYLACQSMSPQADAAPSQVA